MTSETYWAIRRRKMAKVQDVEPIVKVKEVEPEAPAPKKRKAKKKAVKEVIVAEEPIESDGEQEEAAVQAEAEADEVSDSPEGEAALE